MSPDERVRIPGTGLDVSRLCLGGNRLGGELDQEASFALLDAFVELGGNFIDSASVYADWLPDDERSCSEKTIGRWLKQRGGAATLVIATKGGHPRLDALGEGRLDPASLRHDVNASLANLGVPCLDLFYLHRDDPRLPVDAILETVEAMRTEGLIRHYGASNWSAARLDEALVTAEREGWQGFSADQVEWSLAARNANVGGSLVAMDAALLDLHRRTGLAAIPYSSQAKGYFDKVIAGTLDDGLARTYDSERNREVAAVLGEAATALSATPTQVMLHVMMRQPFPTIPVIGARNPAQLASSFESLSLDLDPGIVTRLAAVPPP